MAIIISNDGDKTVATIAQRDSIVKKFDGMQVTVIDAIADLMVGIGSAGYQWSQALDKWVLMWKTSKDELIFTQEAKTIVGGKVNAEHYPQNALVWSCSIRDTNGVLLEDVEPSVALKELSIGTTDFDGHRLHYTYAYGSIEANPAPIYCGTY
jgi:hypothetical protein